MRKARLQLQTNRPVFVRIPFMASGKYYEKGDEFPWELLKVSFEKVSALFRQGFLHHNETYELSRKGVIGDGLDDLPLSQLHSIVDDINDKVKAKAKNESEFKKKKCPKSPNSQGKQVGYIRRWRSIYGDME